MPAILCDLMTQWKKDQSEIFGFNEERYVFGFFRPEPQENLRRWLKQTIKRSNDDGANLPDLTLHGFRHSHASYLINNMSDKFTDFDIANRLGDTVQTLHSTYAHWFKKKDQGIIDLIDNDTLRSNHQNESNKYSELKELKELLDLEIITIDEFNEKKRKILNL